MTAASSTALVTYTIVVRAVTSAAAECLLISCGTHCPNVPGICGRQAGDDARVESCLGGPVQAMAAARHVGCPAV